MKYLADKLGLTRPHQVRHSLESTVVHFKHTHSIYLIDFILSSDM
jgi:hypothetical protein